MDGRSDLAVTQQQRTAHSTRNTDWRMYCTNPKIATALARDWIYLGASLGAGQCQRNDGDPPVQFFACFCQLGTAHSYRTP